MANKNINDEKVLEVKDLRVSFKTDHGIVKAVRGVSFDLYKGETLCIVGESGSGKSVSSKAIMGILANNAIVENGQIMYCGENLLEISEEEYVNIRGKKIGMIFQDPLSSLNPIMRIGKQITEATLLNGNKVKNLYNKTIDKEFTAYKNLFTSRNVRIAKIKNELANKIENIKFGNKKAILKDIAKLKEVADARIYKINDECDLKILDAKDDKDEKISLLKEKFNAKKASLVENKLNALDKVEGNNESINEDYKSKLEVLKAEFDTNSTNVIGKYQEIKDEINSDRNARVSDIKTKLEADITLKKEELNTTVSDEVKAENAEKIKNLKEEANRKIAEIKNEFAAKYPALKEALKLSKANAKIVVKNYKKKVISKYNATVEAAKASLIKEDKESLDLYKKTIAEAKEERINSLKITKKAAKKRAIEIMREVGIPYPEKRFRQYPFEFSGGMRQRIVIAIALTASPDILICDEPTTALDVTIQAQILELINKLKRERNLSCIFITHDLGVVANMADRVAVMYAGKIVEYGLANEIFYEPKHPYTWALLSSIPDVDSKEKLEAIPGTPPNLIYPPKGDAFADRSRYALEIDYKYEPPYFRVSDTHYAATWLLHPDAPKVEMPKIVVTRINKALKGGNK